MELARYVLRSKLDAFNARISPTAIEVKLISGIVAAHLHDAVHKHRVTELYTTDMHRLMSSTEYWLYCLKQSHLAALVSLCGSSPSSDSAMLLLRHFTGADHSILIR